MARLLTLASILVIVLALWRIRLLLSTIEHQRSVTEQVLESAGDGIVGLDTEGIVMFANVAARRMLRCRESDLVGKRFHDVAHHEHPDGTAYPWSDCPSRELIASGQEAYLPDQAYLRRDGSMFPVEVVLAPVVVDGRVTGAVTSFRDVSERHAVDEMKRQFIAIVSHELRTPLTSIKGSLQLLDAGVMGPVTEAQQELLSMAVNNSERLARLVDDILDMERLDAGRMPLNPEEIDAREIASRAVAGMAGAATAAGVVLDCPEADCQGACIVRVDQHRMIQVLTNLMGNAVKFSEQGGSVDVTVTDDGEHVRMAVRDHGRGIPADDVGKVFERFRQVEAGDARRQGGTGLGLAIAREIVLRSDGTIEVESTLGVGSTFTVVLPSVPRNGQWHGRRTAPRDPGGRTMSRRILVVDDDDDVRSLAAMSLGKVGGHEVRTANSGQACLDELADWSPDVVVLDVMMPGMDGPTTLEHIRDSRETEQLPVVFLTASVVEPDLERLRLSKVSGVLAKPFNPMELPGDLARVLGW